MQPTINLAPLIAVLGAESVRTDAEARQGALSAWSPTTAKRRQHGDESCPLAVVLPGSIEEVEHTVQWAERNGVRLLPVGGATGLRPATQHPEQFVAIDLSRLDSITWDEESLLVTVGAGCRLGAIEEQLNRHDYTLGHFPQTLQQMSVGGAIATNAIGLLSGKYGRQRDLTTALTVVVPGLGTLSTARTPYFDSHDLFIGSESAFGILVEATLRMRPIPEVRAFAIFSFTDFSSAVDAARLVHRSDARPAALRILDRAAASPYLSTPALLIMAFEGDELVQTGNYQLAYAVCQQVGGKPEATEIGDRWFERRHDTSWIAPNARPGTLVDLVTVSARWSTIKAVERAMREAVRPLVTNISLELCHPTPQGAAFEVRFEATIGAPLESVEERHQEILMSVLNACREAGGDGVHHGGVGESILSEYVLGEGASAKRALLQSLQQQCDPNKILNRGGLR